MVSLLDVLQLDLVHVADDEFEGTGSIPVLPGDGEVSLEGPQHPFPKFTENRKVARIPFRISAPDGEDA